jgi:hypothetical protein
MTKKFKKHMKQSEFTPPIKLGGGLNQGFVSDAWIELAKAKCRTDMFRALIRLDIGVNEVEDYNTTLNLKLRSNVFKSKGSQGNRDVVRVAMRCKLRDSVSTVNEVTRKRDQVRRNIKKEFGQRTVTTRKILRGFNEETEAVRKKLREEYKSKIDHLRKKFEKVRKDEIPTDVIDYSSADVFDEEKYNNIKVEEISVTVIGQVELSDEERAVLRLHPKFAIRDEVTVENMEYEGELGNAKLRYELRRENEERLEEESTFSGANATTVTFAGVSCPESGQEKEVSAPKDLSELSAEQEARSRQFYDPEENVFDYRKKRVTDIKENSRVTLHKPVLEIQEAGIALRRETYNRVTSEFIREKCNNKNEQEPNLTKSKKGGHDQPAEKDQERRTSDNINR